MLRRPSPRLRILGLLLCAGGVLTACNPVAKPDNNAGTTIKAPTVSKSLQVDVGGCVDWNENDPNATLAAVDCANPHHFEVAGKLSLVGGDYPGDEAVNQQADEKCAPVVAQYLGRPLDPIGRFEADALLPSADGWKSGDRTVYCGITELSAPDEDNEQVEVRRSGTARGVDQTQLAPAGVCLVTRPEGVVVGRCDEPHEYEIVGEMPLPQFPVGAPQPPDETFWTLGEGPACAQPLQSYLGRPPAADEHTYARPMPPESWQLGRRRTECVVVRLGPDGRPAVQNKSLKAARP